jgi:hypothetical protein
MYKVRYQLSQSFLDTEFVLTGKTREPFGYVSFDPEMITPEQRALLAEYSATVQVNIGTAHFSELGHFVYQPPNVPVKPPFGNFDTAHIRFVPIMFKAEPSLDEVFAICRNMIDEYKAALPFFEAGKVEYERLIAERKAEQARLAALQAIEREAQEKASAEAREAKRIARATINWREDGTAIVNLHEALFAAADLERDSRFKSWARKVQSIDKAQTNGYSFVGDWIADQTIEVKREYGVYLLASATGSNRRQTTHYAVVVMDENGVLTNTGISTDDKDRGWALRIRDDVARLLK